MDGGTIVAWKVEAGNAYSAGDVICEIETDKATVDFEAQDDAVVVRFLKDSLSLLKKISGEDLRRGRHRDQGRVSHHGRRRGCCRRR